MTTSSVGQCRVFLFFPVQWAARPTPTPRSGDSASIKSYDNRAQLIPLPIINARIKLDLSDESTERGLIAPITRIMIWIIYQKKKLQLNIVLNLERQEPYVIVLMIDMIASEWNNLWARMFQRFLGAACLVSPSCRLFVIDSSDENSNNIRNRKTQNHRFKNSIKITNHIFNIKT